MSRRLDDLQEVIGEEALTFAGLLVLCVQEPELTLVRAWPGNC